MAYLSGARLYAADLSGADLSGTILFATELTNITWDEETNWKDVQGLGSARNVPESLLSQLNPTAQPSPPKDTPPSA